MPITSETRQQIYTLLEKHLKKCTPPMKGTFNKEEGSCELMGNKPVPYGYDKKIIPGMFFASVAQRKDTVAFYFFPAYMDKEMKDTAPSLYKCLKGKTCFHFKTVEQVNEKELSALLKSGVAAWKKAGYMQ